MINIYRKTSKGAEAIANRAHGVVGRVRSLLIFVDGKRSGQELQTMASGFGDVPAMLQLLLQDGLIEVVGGAPAGADAVSAASPAPVAVALSLPQAKALAVRLLTEVLGPGGQSMCLKIEAAKSLADYIEAVKRAYTLVRDARGAAEAERFGNAIEASLPDN